MAQFRRTIDNKRIEEKVFGPLENSLGAFYKELRGGNITQLSGVTFIMLVSSMAVRVPDHIENTRSILNAHFNAIFEINRDELRERCLRRGVPVEAFDTAKVHPHPNAVLGAALGRIKMFTDAFINFDWVFFRAVDGHFITSDRPVVIDGSDLGSANTMVLFPLGRNFAAIGKLGKGTSTRFDPMGPAGIEAFNRTVFATAPRYIFSSYRIDDIESWTE